MGQKEGAYPGTESSRTGALPDSRGTCLRVDLNAIAHNARVLRQLLGDGVAMMAVVKANAYGHGLIPVARTALDNGAEALGVAVPEEGRRLRQAGIAAPILVLGNVTAAGAEISAEEGLIQTICDPDGVSAMQKACRCTGRDASVHLKIDTGMNRIGARTEKDIREVLRELEKADRLHLTGAYTHFADADNPDDTFSRQQFECFMRLQQILPDGILLHAAASDASLRFPWARLHMVREGIALYGCVSGERDPGLRRAMSWETRVAYIKEIDAGDTVSYGRTFTAPGPMRVATLPVGYGDGYPRSCSGRAGVLLRGRLCPVLGRVCMDQMMVDISSVPQVHKGDTAVLMGTQGGQRITAEDLAGWAGTISYEILLSPHTRVPVIYDSVDGGRF